MPWTVNFYPKETEKFIKKLSQKDWAVVAMEIQVLKDYGFSQHNDSLKKMSGLSGVWELKVKQYRIFLTQAGRETIQILHTMVKKSNKTPLEVVDLIRRRAKYFGGAV